MICSASDPVSERINSRIAPRNNLQSVIGGELGVLIGFLIKHKQKIVQMGQFRHSYKQRELHVDMINIRTICVFYIDLQEGRKGLVRSGKRWDANRIIYINIGIPREWLIDCYFCGCLLLLSSDGNWFVQQIRIPTNDLRLYTSVGTRLFNDGGNERDVSGNGRGRLNGPL